MAAKKVIPAWRMAVGKWLYNRSYFPQIGLRADDTLNETDIVKEAISRLPQSEQDERLFRISRALMLSNTKTILPPDEWTNYDTDYSYLTPYIEQIENERKEKAAWFKQ